MLIKPKSLPGNKHNGTVMSCFVKHLSNGLCNWPPCFVYNSSFENSKTPYPETVPNDLST